MPTRNLNLEEKIEVLKAARKAITEDEFSGWHRGYTIIVTGLLGLRELSISNEDAQAQVEAFYFKLLDERQHILAASLQWPDNVFNPQLNFSKLAFERLCIPKVVRHKFIGGTSTSKTFSAIAWHYLEWTRDPEYTRVLLIAVTESHLKQNAFSQLYMLHDLALFKPKDIFKSSLYLGYRSGQSGFGGFLGIPVPFSEEGQGRLRGRKPGARKMPHPKFGPLSRLFVLIDESQDVSPGIYDDMGSVLSSQTEWDNVKITECGNPTTHACRFIQEATPKNGWNPTTQVERLHKWTTETRIFVTRFDAIFSENVINRKTTFPGIQTYEVFAANKKLGVESPEYLVNSRGYPPIGVSSNFIMNENMLVRAIADPLWSEPPKKYMSVDVGFHGGNKTIVTIGRYGRIKGAYRRTEAGTYAELDMWNENEQHQGKTKMALFIDRQFTLPKLDVDKIPRQIYDAIKLHGIQPENVGVDATGAGGHMVAVLLERIFETEEGLNVPIRKLVMSGTCTEIPLTNAGGATARELFNSASDEMWFCFAEWLKFGGLYFASTCETEVLFKQLSRRQKVIRKNKQAVEEKAKCIKRERISMDEADSALMMVLLIRQNNNYLPGPIPFEDVEPLSLKQPEGTPLIEQEAYPPFRPILMVDEPPSRYFQ